MNTTLNEGASPFNRLGRVSSLMLKKPPGKLDRYDAGAIDLNQSLTSSPGRICPH
jgi:hypothetical protein